MNEEIIADIKSLVSTNLLMIFSLLGGILFIHFLSKDGKFKKCKGTVIDIKPCYSEGGLYQKPSEMRYNLMIQLDNSNTVLPSALPLTPKKIQSFPIGTRVTCHVNPRKMDECEVSGASVVFNPFWVIMVIMILLCIFIVDAVGILCILGDMGLL